MDKNVHQLAFQKELVPGYSNRFVLQQLQGKQKARSKFPAFFDNNTLLYPAKIAVEQSSSELTARWKSNFITRHSFPVIHHLLDMTGGFGLDTYFFSKKVQQVSYIEQNTDLYAITTHNFERLGANNILTYKQDALNFLKQTHQHFGWIYLDPARRDRSGNRKIALEDYAPNILEILPLLWQKTERVLLKVSPMLDIHHTTQQLQSVQEVIVLAVQNEVKELLLFLKKDSYSFSKKAVNISTKGSEQTYQPSEEARNTPAPCGLPKKYLYEPNAAILKAGFFSEIGLDFDLKKLHPNTHLYTSDELVAGFPGRVFTIHSVVNYQKKAVLKHLPDRQANLATRNFPHSPQQMKKKLGIQKDGGNIYLFGCTLADGQKAVLVTKKATLRG